MKTTKQGKNGLLNPKKVNCFQCQTNFLIKFVVPQQRYSLKNNWDYWTGQTKKQFICDACLQKFYRDKSLYWSTVKDLKKRQQMRTYIYHGIIGGV